MKVLEVSWFKYCVFCKLNRVWYRVEENNTLSIVFIEVWLTQHDDLLFIYMLWNDYYNQSN